MHDCNFMNLLKNEQTTPNFSIDNLDIEYFVKIVHTGKGIFLGGVMKFFQSRSKGIYKDPNDCMKHPE